MHKVVLEARGEEDLLKVSDKLKEAGVDHKLWIEQPENFPTCLAVKPYHKEVRCSDHGRLIWSNLQLLGSAETFQEIQTLQGPGAGKILRKIDFSQHFINKFISSPSSLQLQTSSDSAPFRIFLYSSSTDSMAKLTLSFAGAGFLGVYHVGSLAAIREGLKRLKRHFRHY